LQWVQHDAQRLLASSPMTGGRGRSSCGTRCWARGIATSLPAARERRLGSGR